MPIIGVARSGDLESLRERASQSLQAHGFTDAAATRALTEHLPRVKGSNDDLQTFQALRRELGDAHRPLHYLAVPPAIFGEVVDNLAASGCAAGHGSSSRSPSVTTSGHTPEATRNEQFKVIDSIRALTPLDLVRGQYRGYRDVTGVAPDSTVETFATLRLQVDTWQWDGVPFYIRTGKCLPVTVTDVTVTLKRPPQSVFGEVEPPEGDYLRFRLTPDMSISLGARATAGGEAMVGNAVELYASHQSGTERQPYQRLIGDASRGDQSLFAREEWEEATWRIVDGVLDSTTRPDAYEPGTWGPPEAASVLQPGDRWYEPVQKPVVA